MKKIDELTKDYDSDWFAHACKEVFVFKTSGLWPMHCPYMNDLRHRLIREGYPPNQIQNIALDYVMMYAVGAFPYIWEEYLKLK